MRSVVVIGAGPAGLRAAEAASTHGVDVLIFDAMPFPGRKFLVAGRGGLNLTKEDPHFVEKYSGPGMPPTLWQDLLTEFSPADLRAWADALGAETFVASSGRVYPRVMKSAPLLRRWVGALKTRGIEFHMRHRWTGLRRQGNHWALSMETQDGPKTVESRSVVFALGGASWPKTGSTGHWQEMLRELGVPIHPLLPANCGWNANVPKALAGQPLKNVCGHAGEQSAHGELLITDYGLEGGVIYALTPALRQNPTLTVDLKPGVSHEALLARVQAAPRFHKHEAFERAHIKGPARALMSAHPEFVNCMDPSAFVAMIKGMPFPLNGPRPIEEAISSAGGVQWSGVDEHLMLKNLPGVFVAGEMLDWEAPTGGYLMQGCFCTGTRAGKSAAAFVS